MLPKFSYQRPTAITAAAAAASRPNAKFLAGGTDLLGCLRDRVFQADQLVSLNGIKELKGIQPRTGGGLRIGAMATLTEIAENQQILRSYPVLAQAALSVGSPQLRNQGTLGGNLCQRPRCWYFRGDFDCMRKAGGQACPAEMGESQMHAILGGFKCFSVHPSDVAPALIALEAKVSITGPRGSRQVPAESFFVPPKVNLTKETVLEPGELVTEVILDAPQAGTKSRYRKVRERGSFDFALAGAAIVVVMAEGKVKTARIVLSGVATVPWRSAEAEQAIMGKALDAATAEAAGAAAVKGAHLLGENGYKVPLVRGILAETLTALAA